MDGVSSLISERASGGAGGLDCLCHILLSQKSHSWTRQAPVTQHYAHTELCESCTNTQPYITATTHRHTIWGASQPICCLLTFASRSSQLRPLSVYSLMHIAHDLIGWLYMSVHRAFYECSVLGVSTFFISFVFSHSQGELLITPNNSPKWHKPIKSAHYA